MLKEKIGGYLNEAVEMKKYIDSKMPKN